ncbi:MAG: phosphoribosylanthranilate isomerase [Candidatus Woesebacteria bacterium]|nr:phosphoribosylanthranilate isomerase [Candidatus Woesebacteria bacterium]
MADPASPIAARVKICGITSLADALAAVDAGADALGFMFYPASPRHVSPDTVRAITAALPPFVARVGVFVDAPADDIRRTVAACGLDTIQLHGTESPGFCRDLAPYPVLKAFRVAGPESLETLPAYHGLTWLLDSSVAGALGGTGRTFNWALAAAAVRQGGRVVLAGGLTPDNVAAAVNAVHPWAVDVSSGVESAPGRKDPARVRAFIAAVRNAGE